MWARGQINLFGIEWARSWTENTLSPTADACSLGADAETVKRMRFRLDRVADHDPHANFHQGAIACLEGDLQQAKAAWSTGIGEYPPDPVTSLFAAVIDFAEGQMIETPYSNDLGSYGHKRCVKTDRAGDVQSAVGWCEFAFAYAPNKTTAGKLAWLYEKLCEESSAMGVWQRLLETLATSSPDYWWALGKSAEQEKDWTAAADAYQQGAALAEKEDAFRYNLRAGLMWLRAKDYARAESTYQQALALNPHRVDAYLGLGDVYRSQKQYAEAVRWYEEARRIAPQHLSPPYKLGLVARAQGDYEEALSYFDRSLALRSDNPGVLYYKAMALDALGRREEAIATLEQAIAAHQNPPEHWTTLLAQWRGE